LSKSEAEVLAAYYIEVRSKLHGDRFYGRNYEEPGAQAPNREGLGIRELG